MTGTWLLYFPIHLGMSSSHLTNIFQRGSNHQPEHDNGKWTIYRWFFLLKPPFLRDFPFPCLITRRELKSWTHVTPCGRLSNLNLSLSWREGDFQDDCYDCFRFAWPFRLSQPSCWDWTSQQYTCSDMMQSSIDSMPHVFDIFEPLTNCGEAIPSLAGSCLIDKLLPDIIAFCSAWTSNDSQCQIVFIPDSGRAVPEVSNTWHH